MNLFKTLVLKRLPFHLLYWALVWFFFYLFFTTGSNNERFIFWFSTILSCIAIVFSYVFVYFLIPNYLIKKKQSLFVLYTFYALVFLVCSVLMTVVFGFVFFFNLEFQKMPGLTKNWAVILVNVLLIVTLASGYKILKYHYKQITDKKRLENKFLQTQLELKEQELKFLKMQIHPHFLFNTLNTLYGFALKKSDYAPEMILKLSNLLDYILYQVDKPLVFLKDEINHINNYISLEKDRFQDGLNVITNVDSFDDDIQIPPMLLLPLIENAFKHGILVDDVLVIKIDLKVQKNFLLFKVENSSKKTNSSKKGIGLQNIQKRLEMLFSGDSSLGIIEDENRYTTTIKIPLKNE